MTTVYYGSEVASPLAFLLKLEPLHKDLVSHHRNITPHYFKCPSAIEYTKNTYVVKAPFDIRVDQVSNDMFVASTPVNEENRMNVGEGQGGILQLLSEGFLSMFAEDPCEVEVSPPYLHHSMFYGVAGKLDIGRWFRGISFATFFSGPMLIKKGEAMLYVRFDRPVNLKRVAFGNDVLAIMQSCVDLKLFKKSTPLEELYEMFEQSGKRDKLIKLLRDSASEN